jgi:uncharacterized protein (TIGR02246 family)
MGWTVPWCSSFASDFNDDFGVTTDEGETFGLSVFLRDGNEIYHTYFTNGRGVEHLSSAWTFLDLTPYGRQEDWEDSPKGWPQTPPYTWWRYHDSYEHNKADKVLNQTTEIDMKPDNSEATNDTLIRERLDDWARAVRAKDVEAVMSHYAPDILLFDLAPPLQWKGADVCRNNWAEWFPTFQGPVDYEITELSITSGHDVAFCHSLNRIYGARTTGEHTNVWVRATVGLRKRDGTWTIAHEHYSVPFGAGGTRWCCFMVAGQRSIPRLERSCSPWQGPDVPIRCQTNKACRTNQLCPTV